MRITSKRRTAMFAGLLLLGACGGSDAEGEAASGPSAGKSPRRSGATKPVSDEKATCTIADLRRIYRVGAEFVYLETVMSRKQYKRRVIHTVDDEGYDYDVSIAPTREELARARQVDLSAVWKEALRDYKVPAAAKASSETVETASGRIPCNRYRFRSDKLSVETVWFSAGDPGLIVKRQTETMGRIASSTTLVSWKPAGAGSSD